MSYPLPDVAAEDLAPLTPSLPPNRPVPPTEDPHAVLLGDDEVDDENEEQTEYELDKEEMRLEDEKR